MVTKLHPRRDEDAMAGRSKLEMDDENEGWWLDRDWRRACAGCCAPTLLSLFCAEAPLRRAGSAPRLIGPISARLLHLKPELTQRLCPSSCTRCVGTARTLSFSSRHHSLHSPQPRKYAIRTELSHPKTHQQNIYPGIMSHFAQPNQAP